ncbi:MAG: cell surface protein SprA, partial [Bacteroidota bacterium]|nr:cell surface protein SprA [Bacteroidota bacterium]
MLVRYVKYFIKLVIVLTFLSIVWKIPAKVYPTNGVQDNSNTILAPDTIPDTTAPANLIFPFQDAGDLLFQPADTHGLYLKNPSNIQTEIEYDPETNQYIFRNKVGDFDYRNPTYMSFDEYQDYELQNSLQNYWKERSLAASGFDKGDGIIPKIYVGGKFFETIFGNNTIDIRPQGTAELIFGILHNKTDNPTLNVRQRRSTNFDFQEKIQMNVVAKIGDKIEFRANYNTEATFDFENKLQLKYEGKEDDIIQLIEGGNVSMPLTTSLINGSQSLFGIKTKLQFGRTSITGVFSQQQSETSTVTVQGGAQTNEFSLTSLDYEENKHFFLSHQFRNNYENALKNLPIVTSDINILRVEVWVTNIGAAVTENRNIIAFQDLGEYSNIYNTDVVQRIPGNFLPSNYSNNLLAQMDTSRITNINTVSDYLKVTFDFTPGADFEKVEVARKLDPSEYTLNPKLGFISLNTTLNFDQTLAVTYQYSVIGYDSVFQVGWFSDQGVPAPNCLVTKLLKSTTLDPGIPMWDLMMKNVYSLGAYQVNREKFILNILYAGNQNQVPTGYFTNGPDGIKGVPLIQLMNFDNLNPIMNPPPDGIFDFIDGAANNGGTIQASNGKVYFTVLEPFGEYIRELILDAGGDTTLANHYAYDSLYTQTKVGAEQFPEKNKYLITGYYSSSSGNEISLNAFNVPQGSVRVTAGGRTLTENVDYTVDYTLGRVRIINEGILNSGTPINISLENQSLFNLQTKRYMGAHVLHQFNKDFYIGATLMNLTERPLTQKVSYGNDPVSNTMWGMDMNYQTQSRFITKMIDKIPGISTKAPSNVTFSGEFAQFIPGHSKVIGKSGTSYIDDFEGAQSTIDLKNFGTWFMASTPQGQYDLFPEAEITLSRKRQIEIGLNRANLSWYIIDPLFYDRNTNLVPPNINKNELSKNTVRQVLETEVFPNKDIPTGVPTNIPVFNMAYYPSEKGSYNFDVSQTSVSEGINEDGSLIDPESRWGGIMRRIESTDFEATNVEYIEFWLMDPFTEDTANPGKLYINLGDVSEDILRDSRKSLENGLPTSPEVTNVDTTGWGRVPNIQSLVESFDNDPASRPFQDVGYEGLGDNDERTFYGGDDALHPYLDSIGNIFGTNSGAFQQALSDPSTDNYHYFRGTDYDNDPLYSSVLERYKKFNRSEGNSPTEEQNPEAYPTSSTTLPNVEDLNRDNTLSESERYFQYVIELDPDKMEVGQNFITDIHYAQGIPLANGDAGEVHWYQFKVPITSPSNVVGKIDDFKSIRFMRMFMKDFAKPIVLRFATLELVRGEWRRYAHDLFAPGDYIPNDIQSSTVFDVSTVNIEENGRRIPVPYVIPPGIEREINLGTTNLIRLNEQALSLIVRDLVDGDARAVFKTTEFDFRQYKRLKMYVHAEKGKEDQELDYGDLTCFIRIGSDLTENYYEYEVPLAFTPWGSIDPDVIWPYSNRFDIDLQALVDVKHRRNIQMRIPGSDIYQNVPYIEYDGSNKVTVLGKPAISDVMAILIGVRNPRKPGETELEGINAEIWCNELRLTDFNDKSGWAATANVKVDLADFGRVVLSGAYSTPNFGSLEQKVNQTQRESIAQMGISSDLELGKFFPEKSGVRVPLHFDYSQTVTNPEYNPMDPDILMKDDINSYTRKSAQDSLLQASQEFTEHTSINFINVRKDRVGAAKKPRVYDIENFNVTYAYSTLYARNIDIEYDVAKEHRGGLGYNFSTAPKNVRPFERIGFISKSSSLKLIKDFNFYYLPKSFSFTTDMVKNYNETKLRNKSLGLIKITPTFVRKWDWNRNFNLRYDFSKGLSVDFNAQTKAFINEAPGSKDPSSEFFDQGANDTIDISKQFWQGGIKDLYTQTFNVNYKIPIDKIPIFDWIGSNFTYQANYSWRASPLSIQNTQGNQIENSNSIKLNNNLNFDNLYNKSPYLKKLTRKSRGGGQRGGAPNRQRGADQQAEQDTTDVKPKKNYLKIVGEGFLRILLGVKKASLNYTETNGTYLPGFMPQPDFLGTNFNYNAPGLGFVFGSQKDIRPDAINNGWLTTDTVFNQAYMRKHTDLLNYKLTFEPFPDFKVEFSGDRSYANNLQEFFRADSLGEFQIFSPQAGGNFSISYISIGTAFEKSGDNNSSEAFDNLLAYRQEVSAYLGEQNPNSSDQPLVYDSITNAYYAYGYGPTQQEVLMYSFRAAYRGKNPDQINSAIFPSFPLPNWRITYNGLTNIKGVKNVFQKITLGHGYRSVYAITRFVSSPNYQEIDNYASRVMDFSNVFVPKYDMGQITIAEQFAPLFSIDMTFQNSLSTRFEWKKSRNLTMSFANNQVTDIRTNEIVVGIGYRIKDLAFSIKALGGGGRKKRMQSDLNLKLDLSVRENKTVLRRIDENLSQVSAGQRVISINTSADYALSDKLMFRFFFDKIINSPFVSSQYRT